MHSTYVALRSHAYISHPSMACRDRLHKIMPADISVWLYYANSSTTSWLVYPRKIGRTIARTVQAYFVKASEIQVQMPLHIQMQPKSNVLLCVCH